MKYGFYLPSRGPVATPDNTIAIVKRAEELRFHYVLAGDHVIIPNRIDSLYPYTADRTYPGADTGEAPEHLNLLAFVAGQTSTLQLATSVTIIPYRNPIVTAKAFATIDVLSKGRVVVGVGVGWMKEEFEALGTLPYEERGAVTDEYLRAFKELWTSDNPSFEGKYCRFSDIIFRPKPVQKPYPPIWVGGESPAALRRTAEFGNGWYPLGSNPDFPLREPKQLEEALGRLAAQARRFGRDPGEIDIIYFPGLITGYKLNPDGDSEKGPSGERLTFRGTSAEIASDIRTYEGMGVTHLVANFFTSPGTSLEGGIKEMEDMAAEVWPRV